MSLGHLVNLVVCEAIVMSHHDYCTCEYLKNVYEHNRARAFGERESERKGSKSLAKELECQFVPFRETGSCQVPFGEKEETPRGIWHLFGIVP